MIEQLRKQLKEEIKFLEKIKDSLSMCNGIPFRIRVLYISPRIELLKKRLTKLENKMLNE